MEDKMSASDFRKALNNGSIVIGKKGRLKEGKLSNEYKALLDKEKATEKAKTSQFSDNTDVIRVNIKPLSVNEAFKGRRFHTKEHKSWSNRVSLLLPKIDLPEPPYEIYFKFGFSSKASDWDNPIKQCQDSLAEKYGFDDKLIKRGVVETEIVKRGEEYFEFAIKHFKS